METVTLRFAVVSWTPPGSTTVVVGSHPALGAWDPEKAPKMTCSLGTSRFDSEPDYWWADVTLPLSEAPSALFKFGVRHPGAKTWNWEDGENRQVELPDAQSTRRAAEPPEPRLLPVQRFRDGAASEHDHTGRFWSTVNERREISVRRVSAQLFLGSCPRRREHIDRLNKLGITVVLNFQTEADCLKNCVQGIGMEENALAVRDLYDQAGIQYIWLPTWDMSTAGRSAMLPHASFLLSGLLRRGHVAYIHCNAGVGRSVGAVCGYLMYCVGLSPSEMQHIVARARTVAFFDFDALEQARPRYEAMFGPPDRDLEEPRRLLLRDLFAGAPPAGGH